MEVALLRLKVVFRYLAMKALVGALRLFQHRIVISVLFLLLMFVFFYFYAPSTPISEIIAIFLMAEYFSGTIYYVHQALQKIEGIQGSPDLRQITISDCELIKKDLNSWLGIFVMISGIGLAVMVVTPSQLALPESLFIVFGISVEMMTTTTFALLYWWLFFFLMERYKYDRAATLAGIISVFPLFVGSFATVSIALYFGLDMLQDFVAAFLPFLVVYYLISRAIPDYALSAPSSFDAEITKTRQRIEELTEELNVERVEARKNRLEIEFSKLRVKEKQLEDSLQWFKIGSEEIDRLQNDFVDFQKQMTSAKQTFENKVGKLRRNRIGFLVGNKVLIAESISTLAFRVMCSEESIANDTVEAIKNILSLREIASKVAGIRTRALHVRNNPNFKDVQKRRSLIAVEESVTKDMPEPCREFDRKTLKEYMPAQIRFELDFYKYKTILRHFAKHPSTFLWQKFEETETDLLLSINELRKKIQERIDAFIFLEKKHPNCYMVRAFKFFFGLFGVNALKDFLESLNRSEIEIHQRRERIDKSKKTMKIGFSTREHNRSENRSGDLLFGKTYYMFVTLAITLLIFGLILSWLEKFPLIAILFSVLGLLFVGLTIGTASATISKFIAKQFHMEKRFRYVTIEELRREDSILLGSIGPLQMIISFFMNLYGEIAEIQLINGLIIFSVIVFYLVRASARLRDSNRLRFISIVLPITMAFTDVVIVMWLLDFDFRIQYFVSTALIFVISIIFAAIKPRYIQNKGTPEYVI